MTTTPPQIRLWDDNPSSLDLLGFDAVVEPIVAAVRERNIHPLTLSVQSPWGGGKSTILKLIEAEFKDDDTCFVVTTNPWAYDDQGDVARIVQVAPGHRCRVCGDGGRGALGDPMSAVSAAAGFKIDDPLGVCDQVGVMLYGQNGVPGVPQFAEATEQVLLVCRVKAAGTGFIEDVGQARHCGADLRGESCQLQFTA
ncbi:P-loop NTPase fold protein [Agromyces aerolatus]|uniref:P-loop NTPase fold protein n=1 Tax=Agromyces sp. LY-1074 TaxID=3074080 RepID=UPI0037BEF0E4